VSIFVALIPIALVFVGLLPILAIVLFWRAKEREYSRKSPLTRNMLRPPGHSLRKKIDDLSAEIDFYFLSIITIPLFVFAAHISQSYFTGEPESILRLFLSGSLGIGLVLLAGRRLLPLLSKRKILTLGLEGELATGEELNQLMLEGCRVFHDIPFPYGNIDHVVVSCSGVFSVNAKMLGKPKDANVDAGITVDQQRGIVIFPDRQYRIPVEQFATETNWLSKHLSSATGQTVNVEAILALPGWFVKERVGRGPVFVLNPHKPKKFFVHNRQIIGPEAFAQIAHQLEQLCRDVEPSYTRKQNRWDASA
jgi:hypothetical protein